MLSAIDFDNKLFRSSVKNQRCIPLFFSDGRLLQDIIEETDTIVSFPAESYSFADLSHRTDLFRCIRNCFEA